MLTSQVKDLKLGSKVMFKEMSVSATRTCESQGEVEEEQQPYRKKVISNRKQVDQITVEDAFKMPDPFLHEKKEKARQSKRETKRVLHEQDRFRDYLKDFQTNERGFMAS